MLTKDAETHFGGRAGIVRTLGNRTKSAIYQWGEVVPLMAAYELAAKSQGALSVDMSLYKRNGHVNHTNAA